MKPRPVKEHERVMMLEICLSGVDGAGKSMQASLLLALFKRLGYRVAYVWLRWFAVATNILYLYAKVFKRTVKIRKDGYLVPIHPWWIDPVLRRVYPYLALLDLLLAYYLRKLILRVERVNAVIYDRGFIDLVIDVVWETRRSRFLKNSVVQAVLSKMLTRVKTVILVVKPREAARRKQDIVSLKEIAFKKTCYEVFAKHLAIPLIDTTSSRKRETLRQLVSLLKLV